MKKVNDSQPKGGNTPPTNPTTYLTENQTAALLGLTPRALQQWRRKGDGPRFVRISQRCIRYDRRDVESFMDERKFDNTTQAKAQR